jgi:organic radical activating enzyme
MGPDAFIDEVFCSIQGEGLYAGEAQLFIRFCLCNMRCIYCDTRSALRKQKFARIETTPFSHKFAKTLNPLSKKRLFEIVKRLDERQSHYRSISLTGGEPLCQAVFLRDFLPDVRRFGKRIYLETNGTLPDELQKVIRWVETIAMDVKLPGSSHEAVEFADVQRFLTVALKKEAFVKVVITSETKSAELKRVCEMIGAIDASVPLILQPASKTAGFRDVPDGKKLLQAMRTCSRVLPDVRIIPQLHKALGMR